MYTTRVFQYYRPRPRVFGYSGPGPSIFRSRPLTPRPSTSECDSLVHIKTSQMWTDSIGSIGFTVIFFGEEKNQEKHNGEYIKGFTCGGHHENIVASYIKIMLYIFQD